MPGEVSSSIYARSYQYLLRKFLIAMPERTLLLEGCRSFVDAAEGQNNFEFQTNGERLFLEKFLTDRKPHVVFDVGAHRGDWAEMALDINPSIELHCFEPGSAAFDELQSRDWPSNVRLNNFGLGSEGGAAELYLFGEGSGMNSLYRRQGLDVTKFGSQTYSETVQIRTLDNYLDQNKLERIDYLKIDVEGHELSVLQGGREAFEKGKVKLGQFEYGGCNIDSRILLKDLFGFFIGYGYELHKLFPDGPRLVEHYEQRLENFQLANYVAVGQGIDLAQSKRA